MLKYLLYVRIPLIIEEHILQDFVIIFPDWQGFQGSYDTTLSCESHGGTILIRECI